MIHYLGPILELKGSFQFVPKGYPTIVWTLILTGGGTGLGESEDFKFGYIWGSWGVSKITRGTLSFGGMKGNWRMLVIPYIEFQDVQCFWNSLYSLNCSGFFWHWECTWKNPFFQACSGIVLGFRVFEQSTF